MEKNGNPSTENMLYYETIAEAMLNLNDNTTEGSKEPSQIPKSIEKLGIPDSKNEEGKVNTEALDLYSINKSLYNSSKLFPPTERDLNFESQMDSFQDLNQFKAEDNQVYQFNSFKIKSKHSQTERNLLHPKDKKEILPFFEANLLLFFYFFMHFLRIQLICNFCFNICLFFFVNHMYKRIAINK